MGALLFSACFLTAYGPLLLILYSYMAKKPLLMMLGLAAACFWLVSALFISSIWKLFKMPLLIFVLISSLIQDCVKLGFHYIVL